ncbi:MAG: ribbon-helix-helix protein, CopG family [Thermoproteota archaeon]
MQRILYAENRETEERPVRFGKEDLKAIDQLLDRVNARSKSKIIREAVKHYLDTVRKTKAIQIRNISKDKAKRGMLSYLKEKRRQTSLTLLTTLGSTWSARF